MFLSVHVYSGICTFCTLYFVLSVGRAAWEKVRVQEFLASVQLESLVEIFQKEHITMDILVEMTNEDLQSIGVTAFGHRHKILRRVKELCTEEERGTEHMNTCMYTYMYITQHSPADTDCTECCIGDQFLV